MYAPEETLDTTTSAILKRKQVEALTGLSRSTLYRFMSLQTFPLPVRLGARAVGWRSADVRAWIDSRREVTKQGGAQ